VSAAHEQVPAVDVQGDLPAGTTVLEASAGTGKTYTIAGLVTRYVAEGHVRLDQLLVVTFGRAATSELRTRVRERLLLAREALADPERARESADPVVRLLADGHESAVVARRQNLVAALSGFDAATVATTHEFCQQVLHALGTAADLDPGTVLQEDLRDLVTEDADDLYLRFYARPGAPEAHMDRAAAQSLAHAAVQDAEALLAPADAVPDSPADVRVRFARAVRQEVVVRKRALRLLGFDDLLTRVRDALLHPVTGPTARARLQERYAVVLVDEFQDTDPVQWQVLESAFHGSRTLVVIGDPKQAIYAFRGADVRAYLAARAQADAEQTLDTNWRSDPELLEGMATLLRGAALGHPQIVVRPVKAGQPHPLLAPDPDASPVRVRVLQREGLTARRRVCRPAWPARKGPTTSPRTWSSSSAPSAPSPRAAATLGR
jgi:exodeoxyribonuclease V beta subunit